MTSPIPLTENEEMERIVERDSNKILKLLNAGVPFGTMNLQKEKLKDRLRTTYTALEDGYKKQLAEQVRRKQEAITTLTTQHTKEKEELVREILDNSDNLGIGTFVWAENIAKVAKNHNITI